MLGAATAVRFGAALQLQLWNSWCSCGMLAVLMYDDRCAKWGKAVAPLLYARTVEESC